MKHHDVLLKHHDFQLKNHDFLGAFRSNFQFHAEDGSGYEFIGDFILEVDGAQDRMAAGMTSSFNTWRRLDDGRQDLIEGQLNRIMSNPQVSFQWKNPDFLFRNPDLLIRNSDFLLKDIDFIIKTGRAEDSRGPAADPGDTWRHADGWDRVG